MDQILHQIRNRNSRVHEKPHVFYVNHMFYKRVNNVKKHAVVRLNVMNALSGA
jgi:hypothetical protein